MVCYHGNYSTLAPERPPPPQEAPPVPPPPEEEEPVPNDPIGVRIFTLYLPHPSTCHTPLPATPLICHTPQPATPLILYSLQPTS